MTRNKQETIKLQLQLATRDPIEFTYVYNNCTGTTGIGEEVVYVTKSLLCLHHCEQLINVTMKKKVF